ncbi:hypothetical protein AUC68_15395 [Methyloceanibacter methanicus]|uniref:Uncharacterized protein n=1 Tax=Methyloceanibacter methanicus TaxID=1774968 RepID=A0A1E3W4G5_9HYPH|nr:hypothetical protein AUC68_15395 [Methyloceanibacter methanicus]
MGRHDGLRVLPAEQIHSQRELSNRTGLVRDGERQGRTAIPVPGLGRVHPVPARDFPIRQKKEDRRRMGPAVATGLVAEGFPEPATLRMRLERQMGDHLFGTSRPGLGRESH